MKLQFRFAQNPVRVAELRIQLNRMLNGISRLLKAVIV